MHHHRANARPRARWRQQGHKTRKRRHDAQKGGWGWKSWSSRVVRWCYVALHGTIFNYSLEILACSCTANEEEKSTIMIWVGFATVSRKQKSELREVKTCTHTFYSFWFFVFYAYQSKLWQRNIFHYLFYSIRSLVFPKDGVGSGVKLKRQVSDRSWHPLQVRQDKSVFNNFNLRTV